MAKQTLPQHWITRVTGALIIGLAAVGCGTTNAALSAPAATGVLVAPIEGSPEQTAVDLGNATFTPDPYRVAPIEGSPEQTALELSQR